MHQHSNLSNNAAANADAGKKNMAAQANNPALPTPSRDDLKTQSEAIKKGAAAPPNNGWPKGY